MFKSKHVTIKFRPRIFGGETPFVVNTNLKSKKYAEVFAAGMLVLHPRVNHEYQSLGLFGTIEIEFKVHPVMGVVKGSVRYTTRNIDW